VNLKFALPAALCFFPALLWGQLANQPPVPQWLPAGEPSVRFDGMERLLKAILFVAGDAAVKVSLNGHDIGTANPGEVATTFDVTSALLAEKNVLRLVSNGKQAALLELNGDLARKRWIVSDGTWTGGKPLGLTSADPEKNPFDFKKTFDAYNSWKLAAAGTQSLATDPATIQVPQGFRVELVRSSQPGEDSWVSMAFDPEGRITLGMEKKGLLRLTVSGSGDQKVERINDTLLECRGLLYAHGALYANANNSKGLYRLRDADGDGSLTNPRNYCTPRVGSDMGGITSSWGQMVASGLPTGTMCSCQKICPQNLPSKTTRMTNCCRIPGTVRCLMAM
jgi:hypothetical protein